MTRPAAGRVLTRLGHLPTPHPPSQRRMRSEQVPLTREGPTFTTDDARADGARADAPGAVRLGVHTGTRPVPGSSLRVSRGRAGRVHPAAGRPGTPRPAAPPRR